MRPISQRAVLAALAVAAGVAVAFGGTTTPTAAPGASELPSDLRTVEVTSRNGVVASSSGAAARAGARILEAGGNAVDAAVAAAFALGTEELGASGLGGQTYMLICPAHGECVAIDGSALAPLRASRIELQRMQAAGLFYGHKLVAAPATLATLALALSRYGTKPLAEVMAPAIEAAASGVAFSPTIHSFLDDYVGKVRESPYLARVLLQDSLYTWGEDHVYCFPDLACTLRTIADQGPQVFYAGEIADAIVADMERSGGWLRRDDLTRVRPLERRPFSGSYRGYEVVSFPLPGAGGALIEALQILDTFPRERLQRDGADRYELLIEATRLAMADDTSVKQTSYEAGSFLLDRARAQQRAKLIRADRALTAREVGETESAPWSERDTTQLSVVDHEGNAVSVTQTLGRMFGACVATPGLGFPYNCLLEAFEFGHPESRSYLLPLREPFTTQAPTIVRRGGKPFLVLGSVGSGRIVSAIVIAISNVLDQGMGVRAAVAAPRVIWGGNQENRLYFELAGPVTDAVADEVSKRGYANVFRLQFPSGQLNLGAFGSVNAVLVEPDGRAVGVGDPRRFGVAVAAGPPTGGPLRIDLPPCWRELAPSSGAAAPPGDRR
jgi:gamma-glutamyltranspeptidase/glutathione hydrolase